MGIINWEKTSSSQLDVRVRKCQSVLALVFNMYIIGTHVLVGSSVKIPIDFWEQRPLYCRPNGTWENLCTKSRFSCLDICLSNKQDCHFC